MSAGKDQKFTTQGEITPIMENQMEQHENDMETGFTYFFFFFFFYGFCH